MLKSKELRPAIFMHIQKTAGTAIVSLARDHYGEGNFISHGDHTHETNDYCKEKILARHSQIPFISGHFGFSFCSVFMEDRFSFTFLRDPKERILSLYYYYLRTPAEEFPMSAIVHKKTLDDFLLTGLSGDYSSTENYRVIRNILNNQLWQLAHGYFSTEGLDKNDFSEEEIQDLALSNLEKFSYVGTAENFVEGRDIVLNALGIPRPEENTKVNVTPKRPRVKDLPASTQEMLQELTKMEQPVYDLVLKKIVSANLKKEATHR